MEELRKEWPGGFPGKVHPKKDECTFTKRPGVGHRRCAQRGGDMEETLSFTPLVFLIPVGHYCIPVTIFAFYR